MSYTGLNNKYYKFIILFFLYLSQGIPFGFQATALPLILRENKVSLTLIGLSTLLASPWMFKFIWAPVLDIKWNKKTGRRKSWILPLQLLLFLSIISAAFTYKLNIFVLAVNVLLMNIAAATQDIAVDGLAVDILSEKELGLGNSAQVVGYKTGMIISGGLLVWLSGYFGWGFQFIIMSLFAIIPFFLLCFYNETTINELIIQEKIHLGEIFTALTAIFRRKSSKYFILFILFYKSGEIMIDVMVKPFAIDSGFTSSDTGLWIGSYGMIASICGSLAGGVLSSKKKPFTGLFYASIFRLIPLIYITSLTFIRPSSLHFITASLLEHFFGGMLTTTVFAFMMFNVDRIIGATHYTLLASIEVIGKAPGAVLSGIIAQKFGYSLCFAAGTIISALVILLLPLYRRSQSNQYEIQTMH